MVQAAAFHCIACCHARFIVPLLWHLMKSVAVYPDERSGTRGRTPFICITFGGCKSKNCFVTLLAFCYYINCSPVQKSLYLNLNKPCKTVSNFKPETEDAIFTADKVLATQGTMPQSTKAGIPTKYPDKSK